MMFTFVLAKCPADLMEFAPPIPFRVHMRPDPVY